MEIERSKKAVEEQDKELLRNKPIQQALITGVIFVIGAVVFYLSANADKEPPLKKALAPLRANFLLPESAEFDMPLLPPIKALSQEKASTQDREISEMSFPAKQEADWEQQLLLAKEGLLQQRRTAPGLLSTTPKAKEDLAELQVKKALATPIKNLDSLILQGKVVHAVLETAIDSEFPGMVRAIVTEDVFAEKGDKVLIPKGTRALAPYSSASTLGQSRIFLEWRRLILPSGINIPLSSPGVDPLGKTGIAGEEDTHFWKRFGEATLMSLLSAGAANIDVTGADQANSAASYRTAVSQSLAESATTLLEKKVNIMPTIRINQGSPIIIFVAQDIDFSAVMEGIS